MKMIFFPDMGRRLRMCFATVALACCAAQGQVVVSEIMYNPIGGATNEFVELYNAGTNAVDVGNWRFTAGITYLFSSPTVVQPGGYLVVCADRPTFFGRFPSVTNVASGSFSGQLNNGGEQLTLANAATVTVFDVTYDNAAPWPTAAAGLGSSLVLLDPFGSPTNPANWGASAEVNGNPGGPGGLYVRDIVINELLTHTDPPLEDAVELMNVSTNAVDISGWYLSDDQIERKKYRFPTNTIIPAGGYKVVYQSQTTNGPNSLIPFSFNAKGDDCCLSQANTSGDITRFVDTITVDAAKNGVSFGRYPNGAAGKLIPLTAPTFGVASPSSVAEFETGTGAANVGPYVHPVVINEIMYHPATSATVIVASDFVELMNTSASTVQLYNVDYPDLTWSLSGGIGYSFPTNMTMNPGEIVVVIATNDIAGFRTSYNVPTNVIVLGPWTGNLNNAGDTVRIRVPNTPEPPSNVVGRYVADVVEFTDSLPWPLAADGLGGSMERIDPTGWGNTPDNWHATPNVATPGRTNTTFVPPGSIVISEIMAVNRHTLTDEEGDYSDWIELYNTRPYNVSLMGWHLTDKSSMRTQWTFPAVTIPAHGYLVVFCDMKDRTNDVTRLHTNFSLDEGGEFLGLYRADLVEEFAFDPYPAQYADVGYGFSAYGNEQPVKEKSAAMYVVPTNAAMLATNWNEVGFDEVGWLPGTNGFGFDSAPDFQPLITTDVRTQMFNLAASLFVRFPVVMTNAGSYAQMSMRIKFEDGFMAWLNGVPVASNNVPVPNAWDGSAPAARTESLAVQFTTYNLTPYLYLLGNGTNVFAVQGLNNGANDPDFLLIPELTLISSSGTTTGVVQTTGYLFPSTPGNTNPTSQPGVVASPVLSHPGGVFVGSVTVTVTCADGGASIRYTLDGSEPTESSAVYSAPLTLSGDTELRVRAFENGKVASNGRGAVYRITFLGINEYLASNATTAPDINDFSAFPDFIELFNAGTSAVSLAGYHLSDSTDAPFKWTFPAGASIPAGGFLHVWADGNDARPGMSLNRTFWPYSSYVTRYYHCSFKLGSLGESACLFSPSGSLVDSITFGPQSVDVSHGRFPDGSTNLVYFGEPTAGTNNIGPGLSHNLYKSPAVTIGPVDGKLYVTGNVTITLSSATNVTEIRYTTNGAIPTSSALLYTGSFTIATSTVLRARAYATDLLPGPIVTRSFLFDPRAPTIPVLALVIDPKLLNDPVTGIYTNNLKEREVPGYMQYYTTPSNAGFQINAGFRLYSYNTFLKAQKPFTVYMNADYGDEILSYKLFADRPVGLYDRFILRNGNDDWEEAFLRDTLGQKIIRNACDTSTQDFIPCATYLNGQYYGLINIQEKMDEVYCVKNYGVRLEDVDFYENDGLNANAWILDSGTDAGWNYLRSLLTNNMADPTNYALVKANVDIEDVVDYVAAQAFLYDSSWQHNRKWWRDRNPGGKWRWCVTDLDRALLTSGLSVNNFTALASQMHVFPQLLSNDEFRVYAAQRIMAHLSSSYSSNRTLPVINAEAQRINDEIGQHISLYSSKLGIPSYAFWSNEIASIRSFAVQRPPIVMQHVANYFSTGQLARVNVDISGGAGRTLANYVTLNTNMTTTFAAGLPVTMTAVPDIGQRFVRWDFSSNMTTTLIATGSVWRYFDNVTILYYITNSGWKSTNFNDSTWPSGHGQLGYGDGDEATTIGYGGNPSNKLISTYFRRELVIANPSALTNIQVGILRDDGAAVYINGNEVYRDNLPFGTPSYNTPARTNITDVMGENDYNLFNLTNTVFKTGTNIIAVEIHNHSTTNDDAGFDLYLTATQPIYFPTTNDATFTWIPKDGSYIRAVYAPAGMSLIPSFISSNTVLGAGASPWYATGDIFVPSNTTLSISAGVEVLMPERADIRVQGRLIVSGTSNAPVLIRANTNANAALFSFNTDPGLASTNDFKAHWGALSFEFATHTGELVNVLFRGTSNSKNLPQTYKAAVNANFSDLFMDHIDVDDAHNTIFVNKGNSTILQNSRVHCLTGPADGINIKRATYARVENCEFIGDFQVDVDAIDYDGVAGGIIRGNYIHDFRGVNDDAIDLGELAISIIVESNLVERCTDKGVSVGQASTAIIRRNQIRNVDLGVGIKDLGSYAVIENNTFHKTRDGVALYEKNRGVGGGLCDIYNCIFSESSEIPLSIDSFSTGTVSYSLSDTLPLTGVGNVNAQPQFLNASANNFKLQCGSAAIDAGSLAYPNDPDGSRNDIGAIPFDWREGHVMISEINYHPSSTNKAEYVELYNPGGTNLDLTGYRFNKGFEFTFPPGSILTNGTYLVVAEKTNGLAGIAPLYLWTNGTLDNAGETIELHDTQTNEIDRVAYEAFNPWPAEPDGLGPSLSVINIRRDNSLPANWYGSGTINGTPGRAFDNQFPGPITYGRSATNAFTISFDGLNNLLYTLEFTTNLIPAAWQPTATATIDLSNRINFVTGPTNGSGAYRLRSDTP